MNRRKTRIFLSSKLKVKRLLSCGNSFVFWNICGQQTCYRWPDISIICADIIIRVVLWLIECQKVKNNVHFNIFGPIVCVGSCGKRISLARAAHCRAAKFSTGSFVCCYVFTFCALLAYITELFKYWAYATCAHNIKWACSQRVRWVIHCNWHHFAIHTHFTCLHSIRSHKLDFQSPIRIRKTTRSRLRIRTHIHIHTRIRIGKQM